MVTCALIICYKALRPRRDSAKIRLNEEGCRLINCEAVKQKILEEVTAEFFSRMMLSYSFSTSNLYNILHFVEFGVDPNYSADDVLYDKRYHMERSNRRINRIAARLKKDRSPGTGAEKDFAGAIFKPKYYDSIMYEGMVHGYNQICELLGRPEVEAVTAHLMQRADIKEPIEFCDYIDSLLVCGYCVDLGNIKRRAVTLPEVIFYTAIYMSTSTRSLWTLNRALIKNSDYSRALRWYEHYMEAFGNRTLYEAVIWEIFDMLYEKVACNYEELCGRNIQKFWLEEKYRDRKDRSRVLKKLEKITDGGTVSTSYLYKQLKAHPERNEDFIHTSNSISVVEMLLYDILPYAELIALGRLAKPANNEWMHAEDMLKKFYPKEIFGEHLEKEQKKALDNYEELQYREVAAHLADLVVMVASVSFNITEKMLHGLPEAIAWNSTE